MCSAASPTSPRTVSTNCCHGIGAPPKINAKPPDPRPSPNAYDLSAGIPDTPISLSAHIGHNFSPSYITFGNKYTDWSIGATYTWKNLSLGVSYVDTDKDMIVGTRNETKAGVVGTLGVAF
ncbi:hypothetical protein NUH86_02305 [Sphingobium sp. JS3065]|uniref:TorF family putative porin n=1 Tax=Sphingobium sp. JS3065 TaxID=2970925 RepID=UPI0022648374|nr:TorF family putative porin [Sphingobium sp. JS3065]UZW55659.1 hypothetical protein NUH86_02305 [Sphingobium sp. JS3065]